MARLLTQKGLAADLNIGSPTEGMKWIIKWALIVLHTSSTAGNRAAGIFISRGNVLVNTPTTLAYITTQTGTSTTYYGSGDVTNQSANTVNPIIFYQFPEVYAVDVIDLFVALTTGDTVDYYIMVEEASS